MPYVLHHPDRKKPEEEIGGMRVLDKSNGGDAQTPHQASALNTFQMQHDALDLQVDRNMDE